MPCYSWNMRATSVKTKLLSCEQHIHHDASQSLLVILARLIPFRFKQSYAKSSIGFRLCRCLQHTTSLQSYIYLRLHSFLNLECWSAIYSVAIYLKAEGKKKWLSSTCSLIPLLESPLLPAVSNLNIFVPFMSTFSSFQSPTLGNELSFIDEFTKPTPVCT